MNAIENRKETFMSLINYDDELLGLLLGYGKRNAHLFVHNELPQQDLTMPAQEELSLVALPGFIADDQHEETITLKQKYTQQREEITTLLTKENVVDFMFDRLNSPYAPDCPREV